MQRGDVGAGAGAADVVDWDAVRLARLDEADVGAAARAATGAATRTGGDPRAASTPPCPSARASRAAIMAFVGIFV